MNGKNYAGAAWNAMMEEESKESVMEMYFDAIAKERVLIAAIQRLSLALKRYGSHEPGCQYYNPEGCSCGLRAAIHHAGPT